MRGIVGQSWVPAASVCAALGSLSPSATAQNPVPAPPSFSEATAPEEPPRSAAPPSAALPAPPPPAAAPEPPPVAAPPPPPPPPISTRPTERHGAAAREGAILSIRAGVFLYDIGVGYEAAVAAHLARDTLVELEGSRTSAAYPRQKADSAALLLQQFFGDKIYLKVGPRIRRFISRSDYDGTDLERHLDQFDIGGDLGFGMRKQTGGFFYGFDFFGVYIPVARFSTREKIVDPKNGEALDETPKNFSFRSDLRLPGFYIGGCF